MMTDKLTVATRTTAMAAGVLAICLAFLPWAGVAVLINPYGGGFYWATAWDVPFLPPNWDPFQQSWAAVILKRVVYTTACIFLLVLSARTTIRFRWVAPLILALPAAWLCRMSWSCLGWMARPLGFSVLFAFSVCCAAVAALGLWADVRRGVSGRSLACGMKTE